jgi:hypothetical protein
MLTDRMKHGAPLHAPARAQRIQSCGAVHGANDASSDFGPSWRRGCGRGGGIRPQTISGTIPDGQRKGSRSGRDRRPNANGKQPCRRVKARVESFSQNFFASHSVDSAFLVFELA